MSRILDAAVAAFSSCKPLSDAFSLRALLLKISATIDSGYLELVLSRVTLLTEGGSKQMQADAQAMLDAFRSMGCAHLPFTAAAVKLLRMDLVLHVPCFVTVFDVCCSAFDARV
jgi:hypothetical protein